MANEDDSEYRIPLQDQTVFGGGITRKKINFVPSQRTEQLPPTEGTTVGAGDRYLSIVLNKKGRTGDGEEAQITDISQANTATVSDSSANAVCEICTLPIERDHVQVKPHQTSLAHQVCLPHSHPPLHLDRNRQGLKYLSTYGWDPDSRLGLGASGSGIHVPIKVKPKHDTLGLGSMPPSPSSRVIKQPQKKLDAKQTRKSEETAREKRQRIQAMFYQHDDVDRYLGGSG
ncbi:MAG: hypothetical protein Q9201_000918 [Fulgogasparrea decipioides]